MSPSKQEDFLRELRQEFRIEAAEHLQAIANGLLDMEKALPEKPESIWLEGIFRAMHSLKGAARVVNIPRIERLCMQTESVFHALKNGSLALDKDMFDVFYRVTDQLSVMVGEMDSANQTVSENEINQMIRALEALLKPASSPSVPKSNQKKPAAGRIKSEKLPQASDLPPIQIREAEKSQRPEAESLRVPASQLLKALNAAEELISFRNSLGYQAEQLQDMLQQLRPAEETTMVASCKEIRSQLSVVQRELEQHQREMDRELRFLSSLLRRSLMQPFSGLFSLVPRMVRDLAREYGKEAEVVFEGEDTVIDRRILEELKDPLIHIIRNCIDHGLELPEKRLAQGKQAKGLLRLSVFADPGNEVRLEISDDGAGINSEALLAAALKAGLVSQAEAEVMSIQQQNMLLFASGVSSSRFVTDVSGRGLGMAIVAEKTEKLGGRIAVESTRGKGTRFIIHLPQSLTTFRGVLVRVSGQRFLISTRAVLRAMRISAEQFKSIEAKTTIDIPGEPTGLVDLGAILGLNSKPMGAGKKYISALLLQHAGRKLLFAVDEVLGEHESVVKPLGRMLSDLPHVAGACILGDGKIVPVLRVPELMESAISAGSAGAGLPAETAIKASEENAPVRVLVAEDSITVRNMLRNYLEAAGFSVFTAVDGQDALQQLYKQGVDVVVSDVEMPRMNGFELTASIRKDSALSQLPVVLVTALDSAVDRRRGMDAGANAYIVKGSFEKSNLIDTIKRLI